jgi:endonuclease YncB( thermonuclease family)
MNLFSQFLLRSRLYRFPISEKLDVKADSTKVIRTVDGGTLEVELNGRLIGVGTTGLKDPNSD